MGGVILLLYLLSSSQVFDIMDFSLEKSIISENMEGRRFCYSSNEWCWRHESSRQRDLPEEDLLLWPLKVNTDLKKKHKKRSEVLYK